MQLEMLCMMKAKPNLFSAVITYLLLFLINSLAWINCLF
uniref:Uncharacterized protein n=1 Tax=Arundo donax TaxID=35708 RepID=A0A0A9GE27_ARUDO